MKQIQWVWTWMWAGLMARIDLDAKQFQPYRILHRHAGSTVRQRVYCSLLINSRFPLDDFICSTSNAFTIGPVSDSVLLRLDYQICGIVFTMLKLHQYSQKISSWPKYKIFPNMPTFPWNVYSDDRYGLTEATQLGSWLFVWGYCRTRFLPKYSRTWKCGHISGGGGGKRLIYFTDILCKQITSKPDRFVSGHEYLVLHLKRKYRVVMHPKMEW